MFHIYRGLRIIVLPDALAFAAMVYDPVPEMRLIHTVNASTKGGALRHSKAWVRGFVAEEANRVARELGIPSS